MKAVRFHQTGKPDVLKLEDVPDPRPAAGEVLVRVRAAALNRLDVFLRSGATSMPGFSMPHIGGFDIAGEIAALGEGVTKRKVGEAIAVNARVTGPAARGKLDIIGISRPGGFAEYVGAPAQCLTLKPADYSFEEAAAFGCVYLTAYRGMVQFADVRPGEVVLVHAAGSGAGSAAIQVSKAAGATVIATAGSDEKCALARERLRVDHPVNYRTQNFVKVAREVTGGRGVDVVFDPIWGQTAPKTLEALGMGGRWIVLGMVGGADGTLAASGVLFKEIVLRGVVEFYSDETQIDRAWDLARRGLVRPIIASSRPLAELAEAHRQMESGDVFGKLVLIPSS